MLLLPIAIGIVILALLSILGRERRQREAGLTVRRPLYVSIALGFVLAAVGLEVLGLILAVVTH